MTSSPTPWPPGGGEMVDRIRAHDWAATSLGPVDGWSVRLKAAVELMLASRQPTCIAFGPELRFLYNDGFVPILGSKHPAALAEPADQVWSEVWDEGCRALAEATMAGEAQHVVDSPVAIAGRPGRPMSWFTYSLTPFRDEAGAVAGFVCVAVETTKHVLALERLSDSEERWRGFADATPDVIWIRDAANLRMDYASPAFETVYGVSRGAASSGDTIGWWGRIILPEDRAGAFEALRRVRAGERVTHEFRITRPSDGAVRWVRNTDFPLVDGDGPARVGGIGQDITDMKLAVDALRESDDRLRLVQRGARIGIFDFDAVRGAASCSPEYLALYGLPTGTASVSPIEWLDCVHPEDQARVAGEVRDAIDEPRRVRLDQEFRIVRADTGEVRWLVSRTTFTRDSDGRVVRSFGAQWDISRAKTLEERVRESERRFRDFGDNTADTLWIIDAEARRLEYLSPAFERIWGESRDRVMADLGRWDDLVHPDDRAQAEAAMPKLLAGERHTTEYRIVRPDGGVRWISDAGFPILDEDGRVRRAAGIAQDVTDRREAEARLRESERRFRTLVEGIPQLVWRAVDYGQWTWASPQWCAFTGQRDADSHGWGWLEPVHPDDRDAARAAWDRARETGGFEVEYRVRRASDGHYRWFQTRAAPVRGRRGRIVEWLGTSTDIDDLRGYQERQQLLVGELQHRVRNTLAVVRSIARRTATSNDTIEDYKAHFDGRLNAFARTQAAVTRDPTAGVDLEALVAEELIAHGAREGGQIRIYGPALRLQPRAAETLGLAVHELATNAVKYGALASPVGRIEVRWTMNGGGEGRTLELEWAEDLPDRAIAPPRRRGFGLDMLERTLAYDLGAETRLDFAPSGLRCAITLPLDDRVTLG